MSPIFRPLLTGMVPPLVKDKLMERADRISPPAMDVVGNQPLSPEADAEAQRIFGTPVGIGNLQQGFIRGGPLNRLGQFINQELAQENQGEVDEFIGEVGDMANQRFGVDLGSVGQRPMFNQLARPAVQMYEKGGAAFPDLSGDGKITQKDILIGRGVIEKEYGGPVGMQMGGDPMMAANMPPPQAPPMPMPAPEQPPMPMEDQLDPNVVQNALAQAAGGIGDLDQAQNYEQVMNTMRGDQATVEERREELAGVVGPGDANQTPESVLTLVQPVMMLANVDQGIGQLAQQEMTQPMEGPMAGGIMSTVPEPPMMEAGGTAPVNFNKGGEVRPVEYFSPLNSNRIAGGGNQFSFNPAFPYIPTGESPVNLLRVTGLLGQSGDEDAENKVNNALNEEKKNPGTGKSRLNQLFENQLDLYRKVGLGDVAERQAMAEQQKRMTKAQMLFDIATTALAFAAPMEGERPGLSPAERLAMAARSTQLPEKIGARAQAQLQLDKEAAKEERAIELAALQSAETKLAAEKAAAAAERLAAIKSKTKDRQLRTIGKEIVDVTDPNNPIVVYKGDKDKDIRQIDGQLIDITNPSDPKILFGKEDRKTQTVGGNIVDITDPDNVKVIYRDPQKDVKVLNNQLIDFTDVNNPKVIFGKPDTKTQTVGGNIIDITDPDNVKVIYQDPERKVKLVNNQLVDFTDINAPKVIFGDKPIKTQTVGNQIIDITDPENPVVIFGEEEELMGSKPETATIKYISNQERLDAYADGSLDRQETNEFEQKLLNVISKPSMVPFQGEFRVGSVPQLSPAIKRAVAERRANGFPTVNLPGQTDLPSISGERDGDPPPQQDLQYGTKEFNLSLFDPVQGNVNLDSPSWDKVPTNLVDKDLNYPETTGMLSFIPRAKVFFKEQFRELGGSPLNQSEKDFSRAESVIVSLRNDILATITKGNEDEGVGRILKFVQLELAEETRKLTPGMFTTDETALSKLLAVESKLANSIQVLAQRIPEYGGDPGQKFNMSQITKARAITDKLVLLTAEIRNMRKIYQEALQTGAIAVTPESNKKAKDWLRGNREID